MWQTFPTSFCDSVLAYCVGEIRTFPKLGLRFDKSHITEKREKTGH
uniref:Uncharacterized protein n=1 Tax=Anguilla anguilla TaxID=7936 RepID=A0A0E9UJC6_ANGAN